MKKAARARRAYATRCLAAAPPIVGITTRSFVTFNCAAIAALGVKPGDRVGFTYGPTAKTRTVTVRKDPAGLLLQQQAGRERSYQVCAVSFLNENELNVLEGTRWHAVDLGNRLEVDVSAAPVKRGRGPILGAALERALELERAYRRSLGEPSSS